MCGSAFFCLENNKDFSIGILLDFKKGDVVPKGFGFVVDKNLA